MIPRFPSAMVTLVLDSRVQSQIRLWRVPWGAGTTSVEVEGFKTSAYASFFKEISDIALKGRRL